MTVIKVFVGITAWLMSIYCIVALVVNYPLDTRLVWGACSAAFSSLTIQCFKHLGESQ